MIDSRKLDYLSIAMLAHIVEFEAQLKGANIQFVRSCTYRDNEVQASLYAQGRTKPGRVVTWAQPGQSLHNDTRDGQPASNAADYYPILFGKLCGDQTDVELALWNQLGRIATQCGLVWGGSWPGNKCDRPHVQLNRAQYLTQHRPDLAGSPDEPAV